MTATQNPDKEQIARSPHLTKWLNKLILTTSSTKHKIAVAWGRVHLTTTYPSPTKHKATAAQSPGKAQIRLGEMAIDDRDVWLRFKSLDPVRYWHVKTVVAEIC